MNALPRFAPLHPQDPTRPITGGDNSSPGQSIWGDLASTAVIENSYLFKSLDDESRRQLARSAQLFRFGLDEPIVSEGEPGDHVFIVRRGVVVVGTHDHDSGTFRELNTLRHGGVFGEVSCLTGMPRTATVVARDPQTEVIGIAKADIDALLNQFPKVRTILEALLKGRARDRIQKGD